MFAGHIGVGLMMGRAERRINVGVFVAAALLLDILLWVFVLLGWESVAIPADFAATHQADFVFPRSHGLVAALAWALVAGLAALAMYRHLGVDRLRAAALLSATAFSHWILDALVHKPEMPLAGASSHTLGLGLWQHMPLALALEASVVVAGLWLFMAGRALSRGRSTALALLVCIVLAFTIAGMTMAPPPPSSVAMAGGSLGTLLVVCFLAWWLGRRG